MIAWQQLWQTVMTKWLEADVALHKIRYTVIIAHDVIKFT